MQTLKELFEQYNYIQQEIRKQKSMLDLTKSELCRLAKFQYGDKVNIIKGPWQRGFVGYGCVQDIKITPLGFRYIVSWIYSNNIAVEASIKEDHLVLV